jgi:hypothetical protein
MVVAKNKPRLATECPRRACRSFLAAAKSSSHTQLAILVVGGIAFALHGDGRLLVLV